MAAELPDLLVTDGSKHPWWRRALSMAGAVVCFALGIVGWLIPLVTGIPFYVAGIILLALASDRARRAINAFERRLSYEKRLRLRHMLRRIPSRRLRRVIVIPDDATGA
jgi:hypothetical protein